MPRPIDDLLAVMAQLRDPLTGCPWDVKQDFRTIAPYTIEEAYEVADAIERGDMDDLKDELGDLLLQVVFHARMAEESGHFAFADVVSAIHDKMVRRHPHVFGTATADSEAAVKATWEEIKAHERATKGKKDHIGAESLLDTVPRTLPALSRARKLQKQAANVGFDWPDTTGARVKLDEELREFDAAVNGDGNMADELGDALFALVNIARKHGIDPEAALRATNDKFTRRFAYIETELAKAGSAPANASLSEMDALWNAAKTHDHGPD